jgi:hypothetical protein
MGMYPNMMRPIPFMKHKPKHPTNQEKNVNEKNEGEKKEENTPQENQNQKNENNQMQEENK